MHPKVHHLHMPVIEIYFFLCLQKEEKTGKNYIVWFKKKPFSMQKIES